MIEKISLKQNEKPRNGSYHNKNRKRCYCGGKKNTYCMSLKNSYLGARDSDRKGGTGAPGNLLSDVDAHLVAFY